ncbi:hypothetical protein pb186bvf_001379 [Paramecium bursaria]
MSNRNNKSKSPQTKKPIPYDKDLMKYLILQKITKPQPPVELITKTQPDEDSEVEDFKQEIEQKYKQCKANKVYQFPKEQYESSSDASLESLTDVTVYNLNSELHLTDATQPQFIKALNEKLMLLQEDTPPFKSAKQHNYAPVLKSSRYVYSNYRKLGDSNRTQQVNRSQTGGSQEKGKPPKKDTPSQSAEKNKQKSKQIQQILKIAQKQREASFYKKPQVNNNYVNISANINNSVIITGKPPQRQDYRVKTEYDEPEINLNQFQVNPKSRSKLRETAKPKKMEFPQGHKILNYTMDNQLLESLCISRNAKSQNKNYKV